MEGTQAAPEPPGLVERARGGADRTRARLMARWRRPALERVRTAANGIRQDTAGTAAVREKLGVPRTVTVGVRESVRAFHRGRHVPSPWQRIAALYAVVVGFVISVNAVRAAVPVLPELVARQAERWSTGVGQAPVLLVPIAFAIPMISTLALLTLVS